MNGLKTTVLLAALTGILVLLGGQLGGANGALFALIFAGLLNFISYWFSDKIVLRMYRAQEVGQQEAPRLYRIVDKLTKGARLPMPKIYIIPTDSLNAFATGRNPDNAAVAATEGILRVLDDDELAGVMAHELAHVRNRDILISTVVATIAGAITLLATWARWAAIFGGIGRDDEGEGGGIISFLLMTIVAPIAAIVIQLAISRAREYVADSGASKITGKPLALASALEKLESHASPMGAHSHQRPLAANPSTAHMFIVNPLSGRGLLALFSTHPPVAERIARLRALAGRR